MIAALGWVLVGAVLTAIGHHIARRRRRSRDYLVTWRHQTGTTQIVCGNCSGEDNEWPHKTFLTRRGRCDTCEGRSYILASGRRVKSRVQVEAPKRKRSRATVTPLKKRA